MFVSKQEVPKDYVAENHEAPPSIHEGKLLSCPCHNWQRKSALVHAGPFNYKKNVMFAKDPSFDLDKTIFASFNGVFGSLLTSGMGNIPFWKREESEALEADFEAFDLKFALIKTPVPFHDNYADLMNFMETECNFDDGHAEGSFMDHLYFCRDYSKAYYAAESPRILFLHSIMGAATNMFPMQANKIDKLKTLLDDREFKQVAAFPSLVRLFVIGDLSKELMQNSKALISGEKKIKSITFKRVIDNEEIVFSKADFFSAMNLLIIHQLDFVPSTNWSVQIGDPFFQMFVEIFQVLKTLDKLDAKVEFSMDEVKNLSEKDEFGMPLSVSSLLTKYTPKWVKRNKFRNAMFNFSKEIGHDYNYKIEYEDEHLP